ncbi:MAG: hypothetical protein KAJ09_00245 [Deltaproteobacteria bacterium]|nr:hypothetical protein [Deltaproteobacteria bacterium]
MGRKKTNVNLDLIDLYSGLLNEIWGRVSELIGETLLVFFILLTIDRMSDKFLILSVIRVSEDGISLESLRNQCQEFSPEDIHRAFQGFIKSLFNVFTAITENVINRELFSTVLPKLREAEQMISR